MLSKCSGSLRQAAPYAKIFLPGPANVSVNPFRHHLEKTEVKCENFTYPHLMNYASLNPNKTQVGFQKVSVYTPPGIQCRRDSGCGGNNDGCGKKKKEPSCGCPKKQDEEECTITPCCKPFRLQKASEHPMREKKKDGDKPC